MVVLRTVMLLSRITVKNDSTNLPMCISLLYLLPVKRPLQHSFLMSIHLSTSVFLSPYTHWFHTGKTSIQAIKHLLILIPNVEYAYPFFPINTLTRLKAHIDSWTIQWTFFNSISSSVYTMPSSLFCIHILLELFLKFFTKYFLSLNCLSLLKRMPTLLLVYLVFFISQFLCGVWNRVVSLFFSRSVMSNSLWPHGLQYTRLYCPSPYPRACSNTCPLSWWCHTITSSSVFPFSPSLQSFPASGSLLMSQLFASVGQSSGASTSAPVLPVNFQGWFPLQLTSLISLQSKELSRVFYNTIVLKYQFFSAQPSLWSDSHIHTWLLEKPSVQFSHSVTSDFLPPYGLQHARLPCPSPTPEAYSNSCPSCRWCHPTTESSLNPFSSCLQSFPASRSFPLSHFFESGGQTIGVSISASVLQMNIQDLFALGLTGWISLQSQTLLRVFSNTTVQKHQLFSTQPSS